MADIFGEADVLLSRTRLRRAAEGGGPTKSGLPDLAIIDADLGKSRDRWAVIDQSDPLAMLAAKR